MEAEESPKKPPREKGRLQEAREKKGLSRSQLAAILGVQYNTIKGWETQTDRFFGRYSLYFRIIGVDIRTLSKRKRGRPPK